MGSASSKPTSVPTNSASIDAEKYAIAVENVASDMSALRISAPLSSDGSLSLPAVSSWEESVSADPRTHLARTVLAHSNIKTALQSRSAQITDSHVFNQEVEFSTGPVTNQKSSGRCWIFATTNVLRYNIMKKLNLKEFQLSQAYTFFWDKLNKSNYYLELTIENADLPLDDRLITHLAGDLISDGGQWDMVVNLLETYGVVPQTLYPESTHSSLSSPLNALLKMKLREHALVLRRLRSSLREQTPALDDNTIIASLRAKKEDLMKEVYTIMTATLGVPPRPDEKFTWDYYDASGKPGTWEGTPIEFYKAFLNKDYLPSECFSLINDPRNEYSKLYTVDKLGNIWGGRPVLYVNTEVENLKNAVIKMVQANKPVFFGCDVGAFSDSALGIMDLDLMEYESAFNVKLGLTKAERLQVMQSSMTHAMVISGVHLDKNGKPVRWKVENSWGDNVGDKGYFVMSDKWFDEYVFQVVVPKSSAPKELVKVFESGEMNVLPPWDPMGSLA